MDKSHLVGGLSQRWLLARESIVFLFFSGNELRDALKGSQQEWFTQVIPSFPAETQKVHNPSICTVFPGTREALSRKKLKRYLNE